MIETSRRIYWRARVLRSISIGETVHLDAGVILESDEPPGKYWVIREQGAPEVRVPLEYLEIHRMADITFQASVTIVID